MLKWSKAWQQWYRRTLAAYWMFLFCVTHFPRPRLTGTLPQEDKLVHFVAFGLLAFLFWRCAQSFNRKLSGRFVWIAFVGLGVYGAVDEYLQQFVNRSTSLADWLANLAGLAVVLTALEARRRLSGSPQAGQSERGEA